MDNKEETRLAHNDIARTYYELYKDDTSDLMYFDEFLNGCGGKILDLGCGMGHYSKYMHNKGFNVTGIDISEGMLNIAKETNNNIEFIEGDVCDLSILGNRKFDGIVLAYVLQHLSKEEVNSLFKQISNHLEPGAKILLFLREGNSIVEEVEPINPKFKYVINEYNKEEIEALLVNNGWEVTKVERKEFIDDPNSLAPNTLVVMAKVKIKEKVDDFNQMIEEYFKIHCNDGVFRFIHVEVPITYVDLHHQYIDGNDGWKTKEKVERIKKKETIYVPAVIDKDYYDANFDGKIYEYDLSPYHINETIDVGDTDHFRYDELFRRIYEVVPGECHIIEEDEMKKIANLNGYEDFEWHIYDKARNLPPIVYGGPEWQYDVYGIKGNVNEDQKIV